MTVFVLRPENARDRGWDLAEAGEEADRAGWGAGDVSIQVCMEPKELWRLSDMKRYALFEFESYYPGGGWSDFVKSFDSVDEAVDFYNLPRPREGMEYDTYATDNYQVVDLHLGETVSEG